MPRFITCQNKTLIFKRHLLEVDDDVCDGDGDHLDDEIYTLLHHVEGEVDPPV